MEQTELIIIILGLLGLAALVVLAYLGRKATEVVAPFMPLLRALINRADVELAAYGPALAPVHSAVEVAQSLIDDDMDVLVRALRHPAVVAAIRAALVEAAALTDGIPMDAQPLGEPAPVSVTTQVNVGAPLGESDPFAPPQEVAIPVPAPEPVGMGAANDGAA